MEIHNGLVIQTFRSMEWEDLYFPWSSEDCVTLVHFQHIALRGKSLRGILTIFIILDMYFSQSNIFCFAQNRNSFNQKLHCLIENNLTGNNSVPLSHLVNPYHESLFYTGVISFSITLYICILIRLCLGINFVLIPDDPIKSRNFTITLFSRFLSLLCFFTARDMSCNCRLIGKDLFLWAISPYYLLVYYFSRNFCFLLLTIFEWYYYVAIYVLGMLPDFCFWVNTREIKINKYECFIELLPYSKKL